MRIFRRIMLGGGIDIDSLPDTRKLYYKATAKVTPNGSPLNSPIIANKWDATTGEGIIACINDITSIVKFSDESALTSITIPDGVTIILAAAFDNCSSLTSITIPDGVTSIRIYTFRGCTSMQYYDFSTHESVPTLDGISAFYDIPSTCKIIVPDSLYDKWIIAKYWTEYTSNIIKKSDWDNLQTV